MSGYPKNNQFSAQFNWACEEYLNGAIGMDELMKMAHKFLSKKANKERYQNDREDAIQDAVLSFQPIVEKKDVERICSAYLFEIFKNAHSAYFKNRYKTKNLVEEIFYTEEETFLPDLKTPPTFHGRYNINVPNKKVDNDLIIDVFSLEKNITNHNYLVNSILSELKTNTSFGKREIEFLEILFVFLAKNPNEHLEVILNKVRDQLGLNLGSFRNLKSKAFKNISYTRSSNTLLEKFEKNIFDSQITPEKAKTDAAKIWKINYANGAYHASLIQWMEILEKFQAPNSFTFWSIIYNKANALNRMGHSRLAEKWFLFISEKMLNFLQEEKARQFVSDVWNQLGNIYEYRGYYQMALKFYKKAYRISTELAVHPNENNMVYLVNIFRMKISLVNIGEARKIFEENSKNEIFLQLIKCIPRKELENFKRFIWFDI